MMYETPVFSLLVRGWWSYFITLFFSAREATVRKIETIIREQFSLEMKNKEHEIDVISQV